MKIKTFHAKTFREALAQVKKEMGESAVILSSEEKKGKPRSVVVEAAVDHDIGEFSAPRLPAPDAGAFARAISLSVDNEIPREDAEVANLRRALTEMRAQVGTIRGCLETVTADAKEASLSPGKREALRFLKNRGVREEHAIEICGRVNGVADIPRVMLEKVTVRKNAGDIGKAVMLIGPTGVGKTTTVAKLAAAAIQAGLHIAIVSLDSYRIGALEQIRIYSKIMGAPLEVAPDARRVKECVDRHADKDIVFIDTTGRNPASAEFLSELSPVYETGMRVETHLLIGAASDYAFLERAWTAYSRLPVDCIGVTKVDEAALYGSLYNPIALCGKPIAYFTTGQAVPGDIMFPSRKKVMQMILTENPPEMEKPLLAHG